MIPQRKITETTEINTISSINSLINYGTTLLKDSVSTPKLDTEVILLHVINNNRGREYLYTHPNDKVETDKIKVFEKFMERRNKKEPVSYITGKKEFWSLEFMVNDSVLIPRPETEQLVEIAITKIQRKNQRESIHNETENKGISKFLSSQDFYIDRNQINIADIGTGSGAIAIALASELKQETVNIYALDNSNKALEIAFQNIYMHDLNNYITLIKGEYFDHMKPESFDLIVTNPPYIDCKDLKNLDDNVIKYEPINALDGGEDGLKHIRKIVENAWIYLKPQGEILMEIGDEQLSSVMKIVLDLGHYIDFNFYNDLSGTPRIVSFIKK
ncbi:MAG: peptide chain release factor N(5)-glutamine methyltransferase [Pseudomonadota bacterium]